MDIQHILQRWFVVITIILCMALAFIFAVVQAGLI
jgi:hypothetical protein